jgi:carboxyl-terminal processing protease
MQDYERAIIVGTTTTYGKGTVQRFISLDNATSDESVKPLGDMKLTIQKYYRITGKTTQLDGVKPDIVLPDFYNLVDLGERENDYPLESTTIAPVSFSQNVHHVVDMSKLKSTSETRVKADPTFKKINENAVRLRKMKDQTQYSLQAEKYRQWHKRQGEEAEQYDNMFKPIEGFNLANLQVDLPQIQADTSRTARNNTWLENKKKDIQLYETLRIMLDMIEQDAMAGKF